ncbi:MAG: TolC family outer membrane protein [Nevskia sp.]|nr:TolC family outer membrane protein [Nevskia sp.]
MIPPLATADDVPGTADLLGVYIKALDANPQYQAAVAGFRATAEVKPQALAKLLPQLGAGTDFGEIEQAVAGQFFKNILDSGTGAGIPVNHREQFYSAGYQVELQQVLFNWSLFKGYDKSDLQVGQAGVKVYEALDGLRLQTAQDYFDVLAAQDGVRFAEAEKQAIGELLQQTQNKLSSGLVTDVEVKQVQTDFDLADAALIDARNSLEVSLTQLQLLTGGQSYSRLKPLTVAYQPAQPDPNRMDVWVERATTQNLVLQDKHYGTEIARKQIEVQKAQRLPTLDASAKRTYAYTSGGIANGIAVGSSHGLDEGVFLDLKVPIYTGGAIDSGIRAAEADYDRAQQEETAARNDARHNAQVAFLNVTSGLNHIGALNQAIQSAIAAEQATRVGYGLGTKTYPDVLLAVRNRYRAERDYAQARYAYVVNFIKLKQATGALTHADLMTVNRWLQ